jgi:hypothetical protein
MFTLSDYPTAILLRKNIEIPCGNQDSLPAAIIIGSGSTPLPKW